MLLPEQLGYQQPESHRIVSPARWPSRWRRRRGGCSAEQLSMILLVILASMAMRCEGAVVFSTSSGTTEYQERGTAVAVDPGFTVSSDSSERLSKAVVTITTPEGTTEDALLFPIVGGGLAAVAYDPTTKTIELSGLSTPEAYQTALSSMTFSNPSSTPAITDRQMVFRIFGESGAEVFSSGYVKTLHIVAVDDTPVLTVSIPSKSYREGDGKLAVDDAIVLSDPDTEELNSVYAQISSGYVQGQDNLYLDIDLASLDADLSATWDATTGKYTVFGLASSGSYQTVLRSFMFANDDLSLTPGNRTVTFFVTDQSSNSTAHVVLMVESVNQIPVLTLSKTELTYQESVNAHIPIDNQLTLTDADSANIFNATISVTSQYVAGLDTLSIPDSSAWNTFIMASYINETGTLLLTGSATAEVYQTALRTVGYMNAAETEQAPRTVALTVSDGFSNSPIQSLTVYVDEVNDVPVIQLDTTPLNFDSSLLTLQPSLNVSDEESATLSAASVTITTGCSDGDILQLSGPQSLLTLDTATPCVLTLTGVGNFTTYQTILRNVQMKVSALTSSVERVVTWQANDGKDWSLPYTQTLYATNNMDKPTVTSITSAPTQGGTVTITGTNFGPLNPSVVSLVSIGTSPCIDIVVTVAFTELTCTVGPGVGTGLAVDLVVSTKVSATAEIFDYEPPNITSVSDGRTAGDYITITGNNFGPLGTSSLISANNGNVTANGAACGTLLDPPEVITAHTQIRCKSNEGTGSGKDVVLFVKGQGTGTTGNGLFSYRPPSFPSVSYGSFLGNGNTYEMVFTGDNFGPAGTTATVYLTYGNGTTQQACTNALADSHTSLKCELNDPATSNAAHGTSSWEGIFYNAVAIVDGLTSTDGANKFAYEGLVLDSMDAGIAGLSVWGEMVYLHGRNFGPQGQAMTMDFTAGGNTFTLDSGNYPVFSQCTGGPGNGVSNVMTCAPQAYSNHILGCTFVPPAEKVSGVDCSSSTTCSASLIATLTIKVTDANSVVKSSNSLAYTYATPYHSQTVPSLGHQLGEYAGSKVGWNVKYADTTCTAKDTTYFVTVSLTSYVIGGTTSVTGYTETISVGAVQVDKTFASDATPLTNTVSDPLDVELVLNGFAVANPEGKLAVRAPTVTSVSPQHYTYGGVITIEGTGFGPVGGTNWFTTTTYRSDVGIKVCADQGCTSYTECSNPVVTAQAVDSNTLDVATCTLGAGVHIEALVGVVVGSVESDMAADASANPTKYTNLQPEIDPPGTNLGPYSQYGLAYAEGALGAGQLISIYGKGFGPPGATLLVQAQKDGFDSWVCADPTSVADADHGLITCTMPPGHGTGYFLSVAVFSGTSSLVTAATCGIGCNTGVSGGYTDCEKICFKYQGPTVTSVSDCPTNGGVVTVYGTNFGPAAPGTNTHVDILRFALQTTSNITVVSDTELTAEYSVAGTGRDYGVIIQIKGQTYPDDLGLTANLFSYQAPTITGITTSPAWNTLATATDSLVFTGTNFGPTPTTNTITISGTDGGTCTPQGVTSVAHFTMGCTFSCATPCVASLERTITINVNGQTASFTGLYFEGPVITSVGSISMFGSDLAVNTLTIIGRNFGENTAATGQLTTVETCKYSYLFQCSASDWVTQSNPVHVEGSRSTRIAAQIAPASGSNYTVRARFSGGGGSVLEYATGGEGALSFIQPYLINGGDGDTPTDAERSLWNFPTNPSTANANDKVSISGSYFGSMAGNKITTIIWDSDPTLLTAANSLWSVDSEPDIAGGPVLMSFFPPAGVGTSNFSVYFSCDGVLTGDCSHATNYVTLTRDNPVVTGVSAIGATGGTVTLTGTNFGPVGSDNLDSVVFKGGVLTTVNCTGATVSVAHTQITCDVPEGIGFQLTPSFSIAGIAATSSASGTLDYDGPNITSVTQSYTGPSSFYNSSGPLVYTTAGQTIDKSTQIGNWVTITGKNFGEVGYFYKTYALRDIGTPGKILIGGLTCDEAVVTVYNTEIQCIFNVQGAGSGYDVAFSIYAQSTLGTGGGTGTGGVGAFSYQAPHINSANSVSFLGGATITLSGLNFGPKLSDLIATARFLPMTWVPPFSSTTPLVEVTIGTLATITCAVTVSHLEIQCVAPAYTGFDSLTNIPLVLNIEGQTTTYSYSYAGPSITSVSEVGFFGGEVTITGQNLGNETSNIESIIIGGEVQDLAFANPQIIIDNYMMTFQVEGNTIGDAKDLLITIKGVTTGASGDGSVKFQGPLVYSATGGNTAGGIVTITGAYFGPVGAANIQQISVADQVCTSPTVTSSAYSASTMTCIVQPGSGSGFDIAVKVGGVVGVGTGIYSYGAPYVNTVDPMNPPPGTRVTFLGGNYGIYVENIDVTISGLPCTEIQLEVQHTQISCVSPLDTGGDHQLLITVDGVISNGETYTYAYPNITSVPSITPAGANVTVYGQNFGPVGSFNFPYQKGVLFGNQECYFPYVQVYGSAISCVLPEAVTIPNGGLWFSSNLCCDGLMTVNVTIDGLVGTAPDIFSFKNCEVISFSQLEGRSGDTIVIKANHLGIMRDQLNITFDGREVRRYFAFTSGSVAVEVPTGAGQNVTVRVFVTDREATYDLMEHNNTFTYLGPTFDPLLVPVPAPTDGGMTTIRGRNLGPLGESSHIDYIYLIHPVRGTMMECVDPVVVLDDREVNCTVPEGFSGGWNISMSIMGQLDDGSGAGVWQYEAPVVTRVSPRFAGPGTTIFIEGTSFGLDSKYLQAFITGPGDTDACMGVPCDTSRLSVSHYQAVCIVPKSVGSGLTVMVMVDDLMSLSSSSDAEFSYPSPIIRSIVPPPTAGGALSITGEGFGPGGECYKSYIESIDIGPEVCVDAVVLSDTEMTCTAPPGVGYGLDIVVNIRGSSTLNTGYGLFRYASPNVTSIRPPGTVGGELLLQGENFGPLTPGGAVGPTVAVSRSRIEPVFGSMELVTITKTVTDCAVIVAHTVLRCTVSEGTGTGYDVAVNVAGLVSLETGLGIMSYAAPIVDLVRPEVERRPGPTLISITGRNFGNPDDVLKHLSVFVDTYQADSSDVRMWDLGTFDNQFEIRVTAPPGAGVNLPIYVEVDGLVNEPNLANGWFSYTAPAILSVTPVPTQGGVATITGVNFGPQFAPVAMVQLGHELCTEAIVTVEGTEIQCNAPPGVGGGLDVRLKINADAGSDSLDSGRGKFRYSCPSVTGLSYSAPPYNCEGGRCAAGPTGQTMTIYGYHFGNNLGNITAGLLSPENTEEQLRSGNYAIWDLLDVQFHPDVPLQPNSNGLYTLQAAIPVGYARNRLVVIRAFNQDNLLACELPLNVDDLLETPLKFNSAMFSYAVPVVVSATRAQTQGGRITVFGAGFGPVLGGQGVTGVSVADWREPQPKTIPCTSPVVIESNVALECDLEAGEGGQLDIWVEVGGQESDPVPVYSYEPPAIFSINPPNVAPMDFVTILGTNLGSDPSLLAVDILDEDFNYQITVPRSDVVMPSLHEQIIFPVPFHAGARRTFRIRLPAPEGAAVLPRMVQTTDINPIVTNFFNYFPPVISSISRAPTSGGEVTVTGTGFGSLDDNRLLVTTVLVGGLVCTDVNVTVDGVELVCTAPPGSGAQYDAIMTVEGQDSVFALGAFSYQDPAVESLEPPVALGGERITLRGRNFGADPRDIQVVLGEDACRDIQILELHVSLTCVVPEGVAGRGVPIRVTVNAVGNNVSLPGLSTFSYTFSGCTFPTALNFDPLATLDDGSCVIPGCTDTAADNFDINANVLDDSCIRPPVTVVLSTALDFAEYLQNPNYYDNLILQDLAENLGLQEAMGRLVILSVTEGSTVWEIQILDEPEARGQRNDELAGLLQSEVSGNRWSNAEDLGPLLTTEVKDGVSRPILTKTAEPRVSAISIAGIALGGLLLLLWAIFWQRCMQFCAKKIEASAGNKGYDGKAEDEEEGLGETFWERTRRQQLSEQLKRAQAVAPTAPAPAPAAPAVWAETRASMPRPRRESMGPVNRQKEQEQEQQQNGISTRSAGDMSVRSFSDSGSIRGMAELH